MSMVNLVDQRRRTEMKTHSEHVTESRDGGRDWTEKARLLLEGSHGMTRDANTAVALLEEKENDWGTVTMRTLGVC